MAKLLSVLSSLSFLASYTAAFTPVPSHLITRSFDYVNTTEHCDDLWSFTGVEEAPMVVTNVTLWPYNVTDGTPAFCHVEGDIATYNGVVIRLPASGSDWAGIVHQQGCGGPCGYNYVDTYWSDIGGWSWSQDLIRRGYVTGTSNLGHRLSDSPSSGSFMFAYNNRTAEINFAYLATHTFVINMKAMAKAYYGKAHKYSLYRGSSTGGRQGLVAAQRYPTDFDGIIVGHPASNETAIGSMQEVYLGMANKDEDGNNVLFLKDLPVLNRVALASCDHLDGLVDGLIDNADRCVIDWTLIECNSTRAIVSSTECFTPKMIKHAKKFYSNPTDSSGRELITSSLLPGSEMSWGLYDFYVSDNNYDSACYNGSISFNIAAAFENDFLPLDWLPEQYDWDNYPPLLRYMESIYTGTNTDLKAFRENGGKMIITQGWWDYNVTPQFTVKYFQQLIKAMGEDVVGDFVKMFMINGQYHTWGTGPGASANFDLAGHLQKWVEEGVAPEKIVGKKFADSGYGDGLYNFTRPAYPWPYYAAYTGEGDWKDAENWVPKNRDYQL